MIECELIECRCSITSTTSSKFVSEAVRLAAFACVTHASAANALGTDTNELGASFTERSLYSELFATSELELDCDYTNCKCS